jgi:hypothetical protein
MTRSFTAALAAAAVMALASAAPALGATPVVIGQAPFGGTPDIAVDETGRGHFAWEDNSPSPEVVRYCQLPRGGAACENAEEFGGSPSNIAGRAHVFVPAAGQVNVFYQRCCGGTEGTYSVESVNGGLDFGAQAHVGDPGIGVNADEAVYGPDSGVTLLAEVITAGTTVQHTDFTGVVPSASQADLGTSSSGEGAIGLEADGSPVAVYQLQTSPNWQFVWRKLKDGVPPTEANINLATNWTDPEAIITGERVNAADGPALASGPTGLFLFWKQNLPDQGWVQKWTGSGWTTPVQITDGRPFNDIDLHQDATGRLHAVWNAYTDHELRYTWSDDGVNWAAPLDIARGESYPQVRVAAAGDHQGFAVWNRGGPDVVAVPLEALPEPPVGGGGGGSDTTDPSVSGFSIGDRTLRPGAGTTFSFTSSEAGRSVLSFHKRVKGLKVRQRGRRRCVPQTRQRLRRLRRAAGSRREYRRLLRRRSCKAWKKVGEIRRDVVAGRNEIVWNGRVAGRRLSPGLYQARLVIRDAAGNPSRTERLRFRVRRRR